MTRGWRQRLGGVCPCCLRLAPPAHRYSDLCEQCSGSCDKPCAPRSGDTIPQEGESE